MQERIQLVSVARVLTFYRPSFYDIGYMSVGAIGDTCQAIASKEVKEKVALSVHYGRAKSYSAFLDPRPVVRSRAEDQENNGRMERCGETLR